jgi:hypothetical protein
VPASPRPATKEKYGHNPRSEPAASPKAVSVDASEGA